MDRAKFMEAADIVCGECCYCNEEQCDNCPVRKTIDYTNKMHSLLETFLLEDSPASFL